MPAYLCRRRQCSRVESSDECQNNGVVQHNFQLCPELDRCVTEFWHCTIFRLRIRYKFRTSTGIVHALQCASVYSLEIRSQQSSDELYSDVHSQPALLFSQTHECLGACNQAIMRIQLFSQTKRLLCRHVWCTISAWNGPPITIFRICQLCTPKAIPMTALKATNYAVLKCRA